MRTLSACCRHGHPMVGDNLIWHTRYKDGQKRMVRECRSCANTRYRTNRAAAQRNLELDEEAKAS
jgi:hypothetical protein